MRLILLFAALMAGAATPALAQSYYETSANAKTGYGYNPAVVVAGWEQRRQFTVVSIAPNGARAAAGAPVTEWKMTVAIGPEKPHDDDDDFDDRNLAPNAVAPVKKAPARERDDDDDNKPPIARSVTTYVSTSCPAIVARMAALKPLTGFDFDLPSLKGNVDGGLGDGHQGLDLWIRIGDAELTKSANSANSALGRWFQETQAAIAGCKGEKG